MITSLLEALVAETMRRQRIPGVALAVVREGEEPYTASFGSRALGSDAAVTPDTHFPVSSITKTFVGVAVMQLVEAGRLRLDDPVLRHVPFLPISDARARAITVRHLLTHTSGMPDCDPLAIWDEPRLEEDALERYVRSLSIPALLADPGARRIYSNEGFEVLGVLIEQITRERFERYVAERLLRPLGMSGSRMTAPAPETRATGHVLGPAGDPTLAPLYPWSRAHAASGALFSTARDMARWMRALLGEGELDGARILEAESLQRMQAPLVPWERDPASHQGLAFRVYRHRGHRAIGHGGWDVGFRSGMTLLPDAGVGVVVLSNFHWAATLQLVHAALDVALGHEPSPALPSTAELARFCGSHVLGAEAVEVRSEGEELFLVERDRRRRLTPLSPETFVVSEGKAENAVLVSHQAGTTTLRRS